MHKIENTKPVADKAMEVANDPTAVVFFTFARGLSFEGLPSSYEGGLRDGFWRSIDGGGGWVGIRCACASWGSKA